MHLKTARASQTPARFIQFALLSGGIMSGCAIAHQSPPSQPRAPEVEIPAPGPQRPQIPDPHSSRISGPPGAAYRIPPGRNGCQSGMARAGSFCIDRYEASLVQAGSEVPYPFNHPVRGAAVAARSAAGVFPQGHINQPESAEACARSGKRLCTQAEWQRACMGLSGTTYPYGNDQMRGYCNSGGIHPPSLLFGSDATNHLNDPRLNLVQGGLSRSGFHTRCSSDYGVFDMVGNLHEWVSDQIFVQGERRGIFMGGFYSTDHQNGYGCNYTTSAHGPGHYDYSTGFRCCTDPK